MRKGYTQYEGLQISDTARLVKEEAAYWFIRGSDEELDVADCREYLRWLKSSPNNVVEMLQTAAYVGKLRKLQLVASSAASLESNIVELNGLHSAHLQVTELQVASARSGMSCLDALIAIATSLATSIGLLSIIWTMLSAFGFEFSVTAPPFATLFAAVLSVAAILVGWRIGRYSLSPDENKP